MLQNAPQPCVMLVHHARHNTHRHVLDHGQKHGFKQQRETRPGPRPRRLDLQDAAVSAMAARHAAVQKRLVLVLLTYNLLNLRQLAIDSHFMPKIYFWITNMYRRSLSH